MVDRRKGRSLKLDLHTHCLEAVRFAAPDEAVVMEIVRAIKLKGLDGIAITDHHRLGFALKVKQIAGRLFGDEIIIIPGQEVDEYPAEIVELHLKPGLVFRFLAHPGYPGSWRGSIDNVSGIEVANAAHDWHIDKGVVRSVAKHRRLLRLANSDAHYLEDIGKHYNVISLEQMESIAAVRLGAIRESPLRRAEGFAKRA